MCSVFSFPNGCSWRFCDGVQKVVAKWQGQKCLSAAAGGTNLFDSLLPDLGCVCGAIACDFYVFILCAFKQRASFNFGAKGRREDYGFCMLLSRPNLLGHRIVVWISEHFSMDQ